MVQAVLCSDSETKGHMLSNAATDVENAVQSVSSQSLDVQLYNALVDALENVPRISFANEVDWQPRGCRFREFSVAWPFRIWQRQGAAPQEKDQAAEPADEH